MLKKSCSIKLHNTIVLFSEKFSMQFKTIRGLSKRNETKANAST